MKSRIQVNCYTINAECSSSRFAVVSDIHNYPNQPMIDAIYSINPDAVLIPGDFIQSKEDTASGLDFLHITAAHWSVFCSSGKEHDFDTNLIEKIENTGAVFLRNQSVVFKDINIGGLNTLQLAGKTKNEQIPLISNNRAWVDEYSKLKGFKLLLCHHPEYYDLFVKDYPIDLIVSAHAHGGQIRVFRRGLWAPGQGWFPKYTSGLYEGKLLVSRGIGNSHKVPRINNKPEVIEIRLNP